MSIGFGRPFELRKEKHEVLVKEARAKADDRQVAICIEVVGFCTKNDECCTKHDEVCMKNDEFDANFKAAVFKTEERLLLAKHIASYAQGDTSRGTIAELKQAIEPTLPAQPRETVAHRNTYWLENLEQIVEQVPAAKLIGQGIQGNLLMAIKQRLKTAQQNAGGRRTAPSVDSTDDDDDDANQGDPKTNARLAEVTQLVKLLEKTGQAEVGRDLQKEGFVYVCEYEQIWNDDQSGASDDASIWRPVVADKSFKPCGDVVSDNRKQPIFATIAVANDALFAKPPDGFKPHWSPKKGGKSGHGLYIWEPQAPTGYVALGLVVTKEDSEPKKEDYLCVSEDWLLPERFDPHDLEKGWCTDGCVFDEGASLWVVPGINTFWVKKVPTNRPDWDSRPTAPSRIRVIDPKKLPGKPSTKIGNYSKTGLLECRVSQSSGVGSFFTGVTSLIPGAAGFSGEGTR